MTSPLDQYLQDLQQEVALLASEEGAETTLTEAFTAIALEMLVEAGELDTPLAAVHESRGSRASAYEISETRDHLYVLLTDYRGSPGVEPLNKADLTAHLKRLAGFTETASTTLWQQLEESSDAWDMARTISDLWDDIAEVRFIVVTNAELRTTIPPHAEIKGRPVQVTVWDLDRFHKLTSSGKAQEAINITVSEFWDGIIPCLGPHGESGSYEAYLATLPGDFLARIYEHFGPRLLELNVRSFLQARNKVNRGIQDTIREEPRRFLAYNNGVSMTASSVEVEQTANGPVIARINDLQIVNGGQTTASLHHAKIKNKADLEDIWVQAKLSVVAPELLADLVPRISQFANSQNRVNMADFTANDPFHVQIEKLSRTVWAPAAAGGSQMSRWFYERARGQYADAHARERTPAKQRDFKRLHPLGQKFTKTDLAKFENTWDQLPTLVSLGAEKNFREFMLRLEKRGRFEPDQLYFERLVAKGILFRRAEKLIGALSLGGYRAQTVTYTLAKLSHVSGQRIDLGGIWKAQALTATVESAITSLAPLVHEELITSAGRSNVSEWAKKDAAWKSVLAIEWTAPTDLEREYIKSVKRTAAKAETSLDEVLSDSESAAMEVVLRVSGETWFALSSWAKETGNLQAWQRGLAFSLGKLSSSGRTPSRKQAAHGQKIFEEATRLGFTA